MKIGYIGLGNMGFPMVVNLVRAGFNITAYDIMEEKVKAVCKTGAISAKSGIEVAEKSDILFTSFPEPKHVEAAVPELIEVMQPGSIWVDLTTNDRELVLKLAEQAKDRKISVLEAPLTGAVDGARLGKLTFFVGGEKEVVEKVKPYFDVMGKIIETGPLGTGNVVKLVTNQIWFINAAAIGEALVLGKKSGVDLMVLWEALKKSVGDTFVVRHDIPSIFAGHYDPSFSLELCCKDLRLLKTLGEQTSTQMDLTHLADKKFNEARDTFGGNEGELHVCKLVEDASATDLRVEGEWQKHWEV